MPANYGGRLSSVLDINMKDGNKKRFSGTGGIGLISSKLTLEGPIKKRYFFIHFIWKKNIYRYINKTLFRYNRLCW